jgi:outer membrane autotransporter protein
MRKLLLILLILLNFKCFSQKNYIYAGTGAFFNSPINDWKQLLGANVEYGRYLKSGISLGVNFGYWSLLKDYQYNGVKITYPILEKESYSFSISGGVSYFYKFKDVLFEYDLNTNILLKNNYYLCLSYCCQSGLGYDKAQSFNIGINKDF